MFKCNDCWREYASKYSLTRHKCKLNINEMLSKNTNTDCKKNETLKIVDDLQRQLQSLQDKHIETLKTVDDLQKRLDALQSRYDGVVDKVIQVNLNNNNTNTTINKGHNNIIKIKKKIVNIYTRTTGELETIYKNEITPDSIRGGIDYMTKIMVNKTLKNQDGSNMVSIADKSRKIIKYELPTGEIIDDIGCLKLINIHRDIILEQLNSVMKDESISFDEKLDIDSKICVGLFDIKDEEKLNHWGNSLIKNL